MKPEELAVLLKSGVIDPNVETYRMVLSSTPPEKATDPYWRDVLSLYHQLDQPQREVIVSVMRQVAVDTCSSILGVIDNANQLEGAGEFELTMDGESVSGDLQDFFLEHVEED